MSRIKKRQRKKNERGMRVWRFANGAELRFAASRSGKTNALLGGQLFAWGVPQDRVDEILNEEWE